MPTTGEFAICTYQESVNKLYGAGPNDNSSSGWLTGHHLIPDHCFFKVGSLRGMGNLGDFLIDDLAGKPYSEMSAPVILLSSKQTGAPTHNHRKVHAIFDPKENDLAGSDYTWTYGQAVALCLESLEAFGAGVKSEAAIALKRYFETHLGLTNESELRAGTNGKSMQSALENTRKSTRVRDTSHRYNPY